MGTYISDTPHPSIPVTWTDDPVVADQTFIKRTHLVELRQSLEAMDGHYHIFGGQNSTSEWPDVTVNWNTATPNIYVDATFIEAEHFQEIIEYQKDFEGHNHNVTIGDGTWASTQYLPGFSFEDDPLETDVLWIKASAINELRAHQEDMAVHTHSVDCACECTCTCTCTCECTCTCRCTCDWHI